MTKSECRDCQNEIEQNGKLCPWRHISGDYCDKVEQKEPCDYCCCTPSSVTTIYNDYDSNGVLIYSESHSDKPFYCPFCGRKLGV